LAVIAAFALGYIQYQQVQRKNLDTYISRYMLERETWIKTQSHMVVTGTEANAQVENPYAGNPFLEIKATAADNPFQSEDR
jgi:hypothetical protein